MITVLNSNGIRVKWTIKKRPGMDAENFSLAQIAVFAIGGGDVYPLAINDTSGGVLNVSFVGSQPIGVGVYDLKAVWVKNGGSSRPFGGPFPVKRDSSNENWKLDGRCLMCAYVDGAFAVTDVPGEETDPENDAPTIKVTSWAASYGYDGLSAFETAQLYGLTTALTEKEWAQMRASYVDTNQIGNGAIITEKIADGAVTSQKIRDEQILTQHIHDGAVTEPKIATGAVTTPKISGGETAPGVYTSPAVTTEKIADEAVTEPKIAPYSVTTSKIKNSAVTTDKIADENVTTEKIADAAVTTEKLADGAVTRDKIAEHAVDDLYAAWADLMAQYRPIVINGNAENAPDEEDLTSVDGLLKFKGRPAVDGAKGLKWVRSKDDFVADLSDTIYVVRSLISINGGNKNIGNNCTVLMAGGKLVDGSLTFGQGGVVASVYAYEYTEDFEFLGNFKDETVNNLQDQIDAIVSEKATVGLTSSNNVIFAGESTTITLTATISGATASRVVISGGNIGTPVVGTTATDTLSPTVPGTAATYTATFTISGKTRTANRAVTAAYPIYYGAGAQVSDVLGVAGCKASARTSPTATYNVTIAGSAKYIWFFVPAGMTQITSAKWNGFDFPLETQADQTLGDVTYKVYRTPNTNEVGTYNIQINS